MIEAGGAETRTVNHVTPQILVVPNIHERQESSTLATAAKPGFSAATGCRIQKDPRPPRRSGLRAGVTFKSAEFDERSRVANPPCRPSRVLRIIPCGPSRQARPLAMGFPGQVVSPGSTRHGTGSTAAVTFGLAARDCGGQAGSRCVAFIGRDAEDAAMARAGAAVHPAIPAGLGPKDLQARAKEGQPS